MPSLSQTMCLVQGLQAVNDDAEEHIATMLSTDNTAIGVLLQQTENRHGRAGRVWQHTRNDQPWFFNFALQPSFLKSGSWRSLFRVPIRILEHLVRTLRTDLTRATTNFRTALPCELRIAAFLMYTGGPSCDAVGSQLGIGPSTVSTAVKCVSRAIASTYHTELQVPSTEQELAAGMDGFKSIRGLPYCVGAIDGTHVPWPACPEEQYYDYRCYKGFSSAVILAEVSANRRFIHADIGRPGVFGDLTIFAQCSLKKIIDKGEWLGTDIRDLKIGEVDVRPYLIGYCAFTLGVNMMKSSSKTEIRANTVLKTWDGIASQSQKACGMCVRHVESPFCYL